ncbi:MAG: MarR family transcriptional regulator [Anaerolineales bacterium]
MSSTKQFSEVLHEWVKVFMQRSMSDFKRFMDETELSSSQMNVLMRLHFGGKSDVTDIAAGMGVTNAAASQTVDRLVQRKLLERTEDPIDRRFKQITLTAQGQTLVERSFEARRRWMDEMSRVLSLQQQEEIAAALAVLTAAAQKTENRNAV